VLRSTFQLAPGLGPTREHALWRHGIACWADCERIEAAAQARPIARMGGAALGSLRAAVDAAVSAHDAGDVNGLAALVPANEHWRLFDAFGAGAAYLDIETSDDVVGYAGISAIGVLDRDGPRLFLAGRDLHRFPEAAQGWSLLVTFNGLSFDLPILRQAFPDWQPPVGHIDLRHVLGRLGHRGTLKQLEERLPALHLERPERLRGLSGSGASALFHRGREGDREALRCFAEYNLYDTVNLRTLMAYAYNGLVELLCRGAPALRAATAPVPVPGRGDVLYDVTKLLLAL
jgi:uncharacterized protein